MVNHKLIESRMIFIIFYLKKTEKIMLNVYKSYATYPFRPQYIVRCFRPTLMLKITQVISK